VKHLVREQIFGILCNGQERGLKIYEKKNSGWDLSKQSKSDDDETVKNGAKFQPYQIITRV